MLEKADHLPLPTEVLDQHIAILGKTGSGKSNAAKVIVEWLLDRGERVCILDPTNTWWGMRLSARAAMRRRIPSRSSAAIAPTWLSEQRTGPRWPRRSERRTRRRSLPRGR